MGYHMRRSDREIKDFTVMEEIIRNGKFAVIALSNNNEPYIVSLSYGYDEADRMLYFHCAKEGLKTDFLRVNPAVCLTILDDQGYIPNECSHAYRTIVIRGKMEFLESEADKVKGIEILIHHFEENPDRMLEKVRNKTATWNNTEVMRLRIEEITGKERIIVKHT